MGIQGNQHELPEAPKVGFTFQPSKKRNSPKSGSIKGRMIFKLESGSSTIEKSVAAEKIITQGEDKPKLGFIDKFRFTLIETTKDGKKVWFKVNKSSLKKRLGILVKSDANAHKQIKKSLMTPLEKEFYKLSQNLVKTEQGYDKAISETSDEKRKKGLENGKEQAINKLKNPFTENQKNTLNLNNKSRQEKITNAKSNKKESLINELKQDLEKTKKLIEKLSSTWPDIYSGDLEDAYNQEVLRLESAILVLLSKKPQMEEGYTAQGERNVDLKTIISDDTTHFNEYYQQNIEININDAKHEIRPLKQLVLDAARPLAITIKKSENETIEATRKNVKIINKSGKEEVDETASGINQITDLAIKLSAYTKSPEQIQTLIKYPQQTFSADGATLVQKLVDIGNNPTGDDTFYEYIIQDNKIVGFETRTNLIEKTQVDGEGVPVNDWIAITRIDFKQNDDGSYDYENGKITITAWKKNEVAAE